MAKLRFPVTLEVFRARASTKTRRAWHTPLINGAKCLFWTGARSQWGYGVVRWRYGKEKKPTEFIVSRLTLAYSIERMLTSSEIACHRCNNSRCVELKHLYIGDALQNAKDRQEKVKEYGTSADKHWHHRRVLALRARRGSASRGVKRRYARLADYPYAPNTWIESRIACRTRKISAPKGYGLSNPCQIWQGAKRKFGYPILLVHDVTNKKRQLKMHRYVAGRNAGRLLKEDDWVCHHCDRPSCIEPTHLYVGDEFTNGRDRAERGRHTWRRQKLQAPPAPIKFTNEHWQQFLDVYFADPGLYMKLFIKQHGGVTVASLSEQHSLQKSQVTNHIVAYRKGIIAHQKKQQDLRVKIGAAYYGSQGKGYAYKPKETLKSVISKFGISNESAAMQVIIGSQRHTLKRPLWVKVLARSPSAFAYYKKHQPQRDVTLRLYKSYASNRRAAAERRRQRERNATS